MSLTINEFFNQYTVGRGVDYDGQYRYQCFDLANEYIKQRTDENPIISLASAKDIWFQPSRIFPSSVNYEQIANTPDNYPERGDIVVWDSWIGNDDGHVAIVISADVNYLTVLQQDGYNREQGITEMTWSYASVLGWYRLGESKQFPEQRLNILDVIQEKIQAEETKYISKELKDNIINCYINGDFVYPIRILNWHIRDLIDNQKDFKTLKTEYQKVVTQKRDELAQKENQIAELQKELDSSKNWTQDKAVIANENEPKQFSWDKTFVGLSKFGFFEGFLGILAIVILAVLNSFYPNLNDSTTAIIQAYPWLQTAMMANRGIYLIIKQVFDSRNARP